MKKFNISFITRLNERLVEAMAKPATLVRNSFKSFLHVVSHTLDVFSKGKGEAAAFKNEKQTVSEKSPTNLSNNPFNPPIEISFTNRHTGEINSVEIPLADFIRGTAAETDEMGEIGEIIEIREMANEEGELSFIIIELEFVPEMMIGDKRKTKKTNQEASGEKEGPPSMLLPPSTRLH